MYYVTKDLQDFNYAHRLGHGYSSSKCVFLHGHGGGVQVTLGSSCLDQYGMVIDFGTIKTLFNTWVQENFDHATIVSESDTALLEFLTKEKQRHFVIPANINSTAEFMSRFLFEKFEELLKIGQTVTDNKIQIPTAVELVEVKVWETKDSFATWKRE